MADHDHQSDPPPPVPDRSRISDPRVMSFGQHLEELRRRLIWSLVLLTPIFGATLYWGNDLLEFTLRPVRQMLKAQGFPPDLIATGVLETLGVWLKVSGVLTIIAGVPILMYQIWLFVKPGLYPHERRYAQFLVPLSMALSAAGLAFLYYVMLPAMLGFLIQFSASIGQPAPTSAPLPPGITLPTFPILDIDPADPPPGSFWYNRSAQEFRVAVPPATDAGKAPATPEIRGIPMTRSTGISQQYRVSEYVDLLFTMSLAFVAGFQTPVVVLLLGWVGIFERKTLAKSRKYAFFIAFVVAAILTPSPDPFNMTILALPLYVLYELGLFLLKIFPPDRVARGRPRPGSGAEEIPAQREEPDAGDE